MDTETIDADAFNAFEAAGWEQRASAYAGYFTGITARLIDPLLDAAQVGPGTRMLDIASGPGRVAAAGAARGATVLGVDVAASMVELASGTYPDLEFRQGDAQQLHLADAAFDAVVGNFVILHLGWPDRAAAEFARVLAPGGRVALTTWDLPERTRLMGVLVDAVNEAGAVPPPDLPPGPSFFRFADETVFTALLTGAGFTGVSVRTVTFEQHIDDTGRLWDALLAGSVRISPLVLGQSKATQVRIRETFDRLIARHASAGGGVDLPISVKLASGVRPA
ncbi:MAG: class I SAM-dependent methyltransferase [Sporichthyaceae bacterium]|nr:class I SAM-dependent methyltransferase [Sporichthyaceae bacterium]